MKRQLIAALLGLALAASVSSLAWGMGRKYPPQHMGPLAPLKDSVGPLVPDCPPEIPNCWPGSPGAKK